MFVCSVLLSGGAAVGWVGGCVENYAVLQQEPWVECDSCKRWVHQICALFNSRKNSHEHASYYCPSCILENRRSCVGCF